MVRWNKKDLGGKKMEKEWYQSKTVYAGLIIAVYGILSALGVNLVPYKEVIISVATGLGLVGIRSALK